MTYQYAVNAVFAFVEHLNILVEKLHPVLNFVLAVLMGFSLGR